MYEDEEAGTPGERTGMLGGGTKRAAPAGPPLIPSWFLAGLLLLGLLALVLVGTAGPDAPPPIAADTEPPSPYVPAVSMLPAPVSSSRGVSFGAGPSYSSRPLVRVIGTGGTIAGQQDEPGTLGSYHSGAISADTVVQSVPELANFATVVSENFLNVGSPSILPSVRKNTSLLRHFVVNIEFLPSQAWDKHREKLKTETFLQDWLALSQKINRYFAEVRAVPPEQALPCTMSRLD